MTHTPREVRALLDDLGVSPSRALGQNFVADPNTVRRIARLAGVGPGDDVVEIGAGLGSLTLALAETGARVTAVEVDRHVLPVLREVAEPAGVRVVEADALAADWPAVLAGASRWVLVANLPYNIATPLVLNLLDDVPAIERMLVMVQHEVAERLAAGPGSRVYGLPSVKVAYWARAEIVGRVPPTVFVPAPRVDSALLRIERRPEPAVVGSAADRDRLFTLARTAFGQRRKMLRRSLAGVVDGAAFARAGIAPEARPEQLAVEDWGRLARASAGAAPADETPERPAARCDARGRPAAETPARASYAAGVSDSTAVLTAPAKLTLSLRVTGVRADGYHLIDAEMVSLDLADELTVRSGEPGAATHLDVVAGRADLDGAAVGDGGGNLVVRALDAVGRTAHVRLVKRIPPGAGLGGGSADAAAILRWAGCRDAAVAVALGADVPFCVTGGRAPGAGHRRGRRCRCRSSPAPSRCSRRRSAARRRRCTPPGIAWAVPRWTAPTTSNPPRSRSSPAWRRTGTGWAMRPARSRGWPGAGRPGSWTGRTPARAVWSCTPWARQREPGPAVAGRRAGVATCRRRDAGSGCA